MNIISPENRKLTSRTEDHELFIAKAFDVPVYVEHGVDMGISGMDVLLEQGRDVLVPLELPFGKCRLSLAMSHTDIEHPPVLAPGNTRRCMCVVSTFSN